MSLAAVTSRRIPPSAWVFLFALVLVGAFAIFLMRMPFQVSDNLAHFLIVQERSAGQIIDSEISQGSKYFRPTLWLTIDALFENSGGRYFGVFKAFHVLQLGVLVGLFVALLRVRSLRDAALGCVAVLALLGLHTFADNLLEAYPVNTYMTLLVCILLAFALASGPPALWRSVVAVLVFAYSIFTLETGILVLLVLGVCWLTRARGVSGHAITLCGGILVVYMGIRFVFISGGLPDLDERSAGFGLRGYTQDELVETFGGPMRLVFYAHNIVASVLTALFTEPRAGIWRLLADVVEGRPPSTGMLLAIGTSVLSTACIAFYVWRRRDTWRRRDFDHYDRMVVVFLAVLLVNAAMSFPYTKDVIVGPAGMMYALALFPALREVARWTDERRAAGRARSRRWLAPAVATGLALLAAGWSVRALTVPYEMRRLAYQYQAEWANIDGWLVEQGIEPTPHGRRLVAVLSERALEMSVPNPDTLPQWPERLVDRR